MASGSTAFLLKSIKPPTLKVAEVRMELLNTLRKEGTIVRKEFQATVKTWTHEKPDFTALVGISGGNANLLVGPTGDEKGIWKWRWISEGTSVRWAVMSKDFVAKTKVRWMGSGPGAGRMLFAGKKFMLSHGIPPRPGIVGREWTQMIEERRRHPFQAAMIDAIQRARAKIFDRQAG